MKLFGVLSGSRAALEAVVDVAFATQVKELTLFWSLSPRNSGVNAASAPALARLLSNSTCLTHLEVCNRVTVPLADVPAAQALSAPLRTNRTLRRLELDAVGLWDDMPVAEALLGALVGHPSLEELLLACEENFDDDVATAGAMFAALIAANAPALRTLSIKHITLGDAGLRPLVDALPRNAHLTMLTLKDCDMSDDFARGPLLAAVRANASLRELVSDHDAAAAAKQLVAACRAPLQ